MHLILKKTNPIVEFLRYWFLGNLNIENYYTKIIVNIIIFSLFRYEIYKIIFIIINNIRQKSPKSFLFVRLIFTKITYKFGNNNGLKLHVENASKI